MKRVLLTTLLLASTAVAANAADLLVVEPASEALPSSFSGVITRKESRAL